MTDLRPGDLVTATMTAHVQTVALGTITLRLPSGTLLPLRDAEPGVTIAHVRPATKDGAS